MSELALSSIHGLALCAGVGGLELGLDLVFGDAYRTVAFVEIEAAAAATLVARMEEGVLCPAPVWDDLDTFDGRPWRRVVDFISAGFPCQPWSVAGTRTGLADARWLWPPIARILREVRPLGLLLENVPGLVRGGLGYVLRDLFALGFDARWDCFSASDVGASHGRERIFLVAYARHADRWRRAQSAALARQWASGHDRRASGTLADACRSGPQGRELADPSRRGNGSEAPRPTTEFRGASVEYPTGNGSARRTSDARRETQLRFAFAGGTLADPQRPGLPGLGPPHDDHGHHAPGHEPHRRHPAPDVADPHSRTLRVEPERHLQDEAERLYAIPRPAVPLFPPGPGDLDAWRAILAERPDLAPATPQRSLRRVAHGPAPGLDGDLVPRVDRLRACGNAVLPLAAAYAFCTLLARFED
jgi:DNA (cytosine-5)-methyltransferase 1